MNYALSALTKSGFGAGLCCKVIQNLTKQHKNIKKTYISPFLLLIYLQTEGNKLNNIIIMLILDKYFGKCEFCYIFAIELMALRHHNRINNKLFIMAQTAITVRLDSKMKSQFDALCEQFGMSANTAFNVFVKAVVRSRSIPFTIKGTPNALDLFNQQREASEAIKGQELSLDEINDEIRAARNEKRKLKPQHDICRY